MCVTSNIPDHYTYRLTFPHLAAYGNHSALTAKGPIWCFAAAGKTDPKPFVLCLTTEIRLSERGKTRRRSVNAREVKVS